MGDGAEYLAEYEEYGEEFDDSEDVDLSGSSADPNNVYNSDNFTRDEDEKLLNRYTCLISIRHIPGTDTRPQSDYSKEKAELRKKILRLMKSYS